MTLRKQAASLMVLHAADVIQPLLILPYAGSVLGPEAFGQYAFTLALTQISSVTVDYGFSLTARRTAAASRHDISVIRCLLAEIVSAKAVLFLLIALVGSIATYFHPAVTLPIYFALLLAALGGALFPSWLFMALERPWQSAVCVVTARTTALILFFLLIKSPSQVGLAAAIQASIPLMAALVSVPFVSGIGLSGFHSVRPNRVLAQLQEGWRGFLSTLAYTAAVALPVPLVQHFAGFAVAGQYSVAEKLINAVRPIYRVLGETLMPRMAYLASHDPEKGLALIRNSLWTMGIGISLSFALYAVGPYIIIFLFGPDFAGGIPIIKILSITPVFMNVSLCMSQLYMFNYGYERAWTAMIVAGVMMFLGTSYFLSYWLGGAISVAIGSVSGEGLLALVSTGIFIVSMAARNRNGRVPGAADA